MAEPAVVYRFGPHRLDPARRRLFDDERPLKLGGRAFDLLVALVERRDRTLAKDELLDLVWPGRVVEENNLQVQVLTLRKLLGAEAIATVPGRGYRFTLPTQVDGGATIVAGGTVPPVAVSSAQAALAPALDVASPPALFGRDADLDTLSALLAAGSLVTVAGAGGIGKTRLAQAALARYGGPSVWVDLAALSEPGAVPVAVAQALGVTAGIHTAEGAVEAAVAALQATPRLLALDNAEHLLDAVASVAHTLLRRLPGLRLLVTSQEVLRLPNEQVLRLDPLALPAGPGLAAASASSAVALFTARARAADRRFVLDAHSGPAVVEICRRLDGIPLAIELAAARVPLLGVVGLQSRLDEALRLLSSGPRGAAPRQQTLRATLDWSHALLDEGERRLLRRLAVFVDGFSMDLAHQVAADDGESGWEVLDRLGALVDKSLVLAQGHALPRYRLLETTRQYALEQLQAAGETATLRRRHAQVLTGWALQRDDDARRWRSSYAEQRALAAELANARAALQWAANDCDDDALAIAVAAGAHYFFSYAGLNDTYLSLVRPLRHRADDRWPYTPLFWLRQANACANPGHAEGADAAQRAAALYRARGDGQRLYEALSYAIAIGAQRADAADLQPLVDEARALEQPDWPPSLRGNLQWALHRWLRREERDEEALQATRLQAALASERDSGYDHVLMGANASTLLMRLGRLAEAEAGSRAALAALAARGIDDFRIGVVQGALAEALVLQGDAEAAWPLLREAFLRTEANGEGSLQLLPLAEASALLGRHDASACALGHLLTRVDTDLSRFDVERIEGLRARLAVALGPALDAALVRGATQSLRAAMQPLLEHGQASAGSESAQRR